MWQKNITVCFLMLCHMSEPVLGEEQMSLSLAIYLAQQIFLDLLKGTSRESAWPFSKVYPSLPSDLGKHPPVLLTNVRKALLLGNCTRQWVSKLELGFESLLITHTDTSLSLATCNITMLFFIQVVHKSPKWYHGVVVVGAVKTQA